MSPSTPEEWCAVHEAGHACHAYILGIIPNGMWIQHDPENPLPKGKVETPLPSSDDNYALLCSGFLAEIILGREEQPAKQCTDVIKLFNQAAYDRGFADFDAASACRDEIFAQCQAIQETVFEDLKSFAIIAIKELTQQLIAKPPIDSSSIQIGSGFPMFPLPGPAVKIMGQQEILAVITPILGEPGAARPIKQD